MKLTVKIKEILPNYKMDEKLTENNEKIYFCWNNMLRRCYSKTDYKNWKTYKDVDVCDEWYTFSNFKRWYIENYYHVPGCRMELDKDLLIKGNKLYAPNRCVFLPAEINKALTYQKSNNSGLPIGVFKYCGKYKAKTNGVKSLGIFDNQIDAFKAYKQAKEEKLRNLACEFYIWLPQRAYEALINYEIKMYK